MSTDDLTVAQRIHDGFDGLTRAERQLANIILENYPVSGLGSITALAENAEVSTPTVARMARKLGFGGFPSMQAQLRSELEATISDPLTKHDKWAADAPDTHILNRFADNVIDNLRNTLKHLNAAEFDKIVALLSDTEHTVAVVGGRLSHTLASYFFTHMQMMRDGVTLIERNSSSWPHYLLSLKEGDVLVMFDMRRYEQDLLRFAEMAQARGVKIILFTDQWGSPAGKAATHQIHSRIEVPSTWDSSVVTMFILEAIISAVQSLSWESSKDRMGELEALFEKTRLFRKFV
ncbi:MAG TPA: MurR/RpiR family transcriptional regulator [Rhodobacteraceae bacterium]|nr:MurR/RpiR family transcriptional regulator [Paracoccaceae bacterium]